MWSALSGGVKVLVMMCLGLVIVSGATAIFVWNENQDLNGQVASLTNELQAIQAQLAELNELKKAEMAEAAAQKERAKAFRDGFTSGNNPPNLDDFDGQSYGGAGQSLF
jgi:outer membrane murein-binding lipoprotein Lpp